MYFGDGKDEHFHTVRDQNTTCMHTHTRTHTHRRARGEYMIVVRWLCFDVRFSVLPSV
jgi:hypothetical protein